MTKFCPNCGTPHEEGGERLIKQLEEKLREAADLAIAAGITLDTFKVTAWQVMIDVALAREGGNQCHAARILATHRNTIGRRNSPAARRHRR